MTAPFPFPRRASAALGFALFFFFLVTTSRERPWADGTPLFEVAESIVDRGAIDISTRWPGSLPLGRDGKVYAVAALLPSLIHVPGAAIRAALTKLFPERADLWLSFCSHLGPSALAALTILLFVDLCRRQGISRRTALLGALGVATASMLWVYARYPYSEVLQALCFTGLFRALLAVIERPTRGAAAALGVWVGLLVDAKLVFATVVPGAALVLVWSLRRDLRALGRVCAFAVLAGAPLLAIVPLHNYVRWGSFFDAATDLSSYSQPVVVGLWGYLLSPGKSLFLFCPLMLLSLAGLPRLWRRDRRWVLVFAALALPPVLAHARLTFWTGDWCWGPRYLVFLVPVLTVPAGLFLDDVLAELRPRVRRLELALVGTVFAAGVAVQIAGNGLHWDHFTRISIRIKELWLGAPNLRGTRVDPTALCGACFEDMYALDWLPPFQPIVGHFWLMRHLAAGHTWPEAERDAPWRRYTKLQLDIGDRYKRPRFDWWILDYGGKNTALGASMMSGLLAALGLSLLGLRRLLLPARPRPAPPASTPEPAPPPSQPGVPA